MPPALRMGAQGMGLSWERFPVPGMGCSVLPHLQQPGVCDPVCSLSREADVLLSLDVLLFWGSLVGFLLLWCPGWGEDKALTDQGRK